MEMNLDHLTKEQQIEALSCMAWLDRRLISTSVIPVYVKVFEREWEKYVGSLELIPQEYKDKVLHIYDNLKSHGN